MKYVPNMSSHTWTLSLRPLACNKAREVANTVGKGMLASRKEAKEFRT